MPYSFNLDIREANPQEGAEVNKRKTLRLSLVCLAIIFGLTIPISPAAEASPANIYVPDDYSTIQAAINAASPGDAIMIKGGTYDENVVVNKGLSLVGEDRDTTIIDGKGKDVIWVTASQVLISGFTLQNGQTGIKLDAYSNDNTITDNRINNNETGIVLQGSSRNRIINNIIEKNVFNGIHLVMSSTAEGGNEISGNNIIGNLNGGNLHYSATISPNVFYDNNFIGNTRQVTYYNDGYSDTWDGNYWSDHIGDTHYVINTANIDQHPLTSPSCEEDATSPEVTAALVSIDEEGLFKVEFSATDNYDHDPVVSAVIRACGRRISVTNGQIIEIEIDDDDCEIGWDDGRLEIEAPNVVLEVTAVDGSGNEATATAVP